ncbi:MAG: two-component system, NarL family, invasion response regulator UvrY [Chthoniobacter sp.]|jgi:DNA-binding NarL/FixJ family response regulator|nr:two-component system, NarL family, invasion response regulator UvrY [Chthoniobacter sp.]
MKVLLIDDHTAIRRGIQMILQDEFPDAEISGAGDSRAALEIVRQGPLDIVLCDINLPGRNGIDVLKEIKVAQPNLPVLMLSMHPEEEYAMRALKAGASGYLTKNSEPEEMLTAFRTALAGRKYITARLGEQLAAAFTQPPDQKPHERLSDREFEVFRMLASGKEVKEVAGDLGLSVKTISTHRENILRKMQLKNNAALTVYAVRNGLME